MKLSSCKTEQGSVLLTTFLTITILTLICATSLYVTSQNQTSGMQTASWQQALAGAESGVDMAVRALNTGTWTNWYSQQYGSNPLPSTKPPYSFSSPSPNPTPSASAAPASGYYNYHYLGSSITSPEISMSGVSGSTGLPEGNTAIWGWVTVDTGGLSADSNGQWYRIRSTGAAGTNGLFRASNNRLDNDLRNTIGLRFDRKQLATVSNPQATRTIEVIMQPLSTGGWARGITAVNWFSLSGGSSIIDSFDSSNPFKSSTINGVAGQYDVTKRQSHGDVATTNSTNSDFRSTYVYGSVSYSGPPIKNTTNVQGTIATPGPSTPPAVSAPTWASGSYTAFAGGGSNPPNGGVFNAGTKNNPTYIKVNGDLVVSSSGTPLHIVQHDTSGSPSNPGDKIYIWVTGKLTTSGSGYITQDSNVQVTWYVGDNITVSGTSYQNLGGLASDLTIYGYGNNKTAKVQGGSTNFIGTINAPNYDTTISGGADYVGALITNSLTLSGGSSFHYDEALNAGVSLSTGSYAFASWFEDNSDPTRKDVNNNTIIY
jgi:hypothetical protein